MSFYTALTGLKGAQTDISTTSNNIANVGSNGFKKSRAEFGDIYGSTPLQAKSVGVGTLTKSITQQFSQGNIARLPIHWTWQFRGKDFLHCKLVVTRSKLSTQEMVHSTSMTLALLLTVTGSFCWVIRSMMTVRCRIRRLLAQTSCNLNLNMVAPQQTSEISMGVNLASDYSSTASG